MNCYLFLAYLLRIFPKCIAFSRDQGKSERIDDDEDCCGGVCSALVYLGFIFR